MRPAHLALAALVVVAAATVALLQVPSALAEGPTAKFAVADYRIFMDGTDPSGPLTMEINGKAAAHGNEYLPFKWKVPDARPYLPLLHACAAGHLNGEVRLEDSKADRPIDGSGPLKALVCKVDLK